ncbi:MAG: hypothetical protein R3F62_14985 [Planctomycetota bacterium]
MAHDQAFTFFFAALGVTVLTLVATLITGFRHMIRAHIASVIAFLVVFLATVAAAELLGNHYTFKQPSKAIHLTLAFTTSFGALFPLVTGVLHWRNRDSLQRHKLAAFTWVAFVLATLGTGTWMLSVAERTAESLAGR